VWLWSFEVSQLLVRVQVQYQLRLQDKIRGYLESIHLVECILESILPVVHYIDTPNLDRKHYQMIFEFVFLYPISYSTRLFSAQSKPIWMLLLPKPSLIVLNLRPLTLGILELKKNILKIFPKTPVKIQTSVTTNTDSSISFVNKPMTMLFITTGQEERLSTALSLSSRPCHHQICNG
jgi:hypothetical protein